MMLLPRGPQRIFMILTFIVIVAIVMLTESLSTAMIFISLISQFLIISTLSTSIGELHDKATQPSSAAISMPWFPISPGFTSDREGFASKPLENPGVYDGDSYPGGLSPADLGQMSYDMGPIAALPAGTGPVYSPVDMPGYGLGGGGDGPSLPPDNPYQTNRLNSRAEPSACDYGPNSEARDSFDADRKIVEHARWRHDPHRVVAGTMRRKDLMTRYVREELDEKENEPWWGRWDY